MTSCVLLSAALILGVLVGDGADAKPSDLGPYKAAAAGAGHDPNAHVRLALWCEAHGLTSERLKHLSLAVLYDPTNTLARGLLGLVAYRGKWAPPDQVTQVVQSDLLRKGRIQEYLQRRAQAPDRAEDQWKLALWCEQNDLMQQATAHLFRVLQLDPSRDAAWRHLGYKKIGGRWDKPERVAAAKAEAHEQHKADKHWKPVLEKLINGLASKDKTRRALAEKSLSEVNDLRIAVPMIWGVVVDSATGEQHHNVAVRLLAQIDSPGSSRALALLALFSRSAAIRGTATQVLRRRDPRDFAATLIALLRDPIKYEVKRVNGPGSQGQILVKQKDVNVKRLYSPMSAPNISLTPEDRVTQDSDGLPVVIRQLGSYVIPIGAFGMSSAAANPGMFGLVPSANSTHIAGALTHAGVPAGLSQAIGDHLSRARQVPVLNPGGPGGGVFVSELVNQELDIPVGQMMLDAQRSAQVAEQQLANDVQAIENYNGPIADMNQRVRQVLTDSVGIDQGTEKAAWDKWLVDLSGYAAAASSSFEPPTVVQQVPISFQPQAAPVIVDQPMAVATVGHSCFGAGTMVRTLEGAVSIEKIRAGDLVLTQAPKTGELKFQPVVTAYHNPPNATLRIELGKETIVATGIHRFWKAGRGWIMARELKAGDALRTLGGLAVVKSVEKEQVQPVFNLQVTDGESFFVGQAGVLAHDNSVVNPTPSPFDAVPELETSSAKRTAASLDGS